MLNLTINGVPIELDQRRYAAELTTAFTGAGFGVPTIKWEMNDGRKMRPPVIVSGAEPEMHRTVAQVVQAVWSGFDVRVAASF